jgi:hypothetical protein
VRGGEQPAEVRVALARLAQEREVGAVVERDLRARDRPHAERLQRLCHLHRAVKPVVVGQRESRVAVLSRYTGELCRMRRAVKKGIGGVAMKLNVRHEHMFAQPSSRGLTLK